MTQDQRQRVGIAGCSVAVIGALGAGIEKLREGASSVRIIIPFVCAAALLAVGIGFLRQARDGQREE